MVPECCSIGLQRTFRPVSRAGYQPDINAGPLAQPVNGGEGVFLRATDYQTGNDMNNAHAGTPAAGWLSRPVIVSSVPELSCVHSGVPARFSSMPDNVEWLSFYRSGDMQFRPNHNAPGNNLR